MFVDTTFLIDFLRGDQQAIEWYASVETMVFTSELNIFEFAEGIYRSGRDMPLKFEKLYALVNKMAILPFDRKAALKAAMLSANLTKQGKKIGELDTLIAAIALSNGVNEIVTENKEHFEKIPELKVWTY